MGLFQKTLRTLVLSLFFLTSALADGTKPWTNHYKKWIPDSTVEHLKRYRELEHSIIPIKKVKKDKDGKEIKIEEAADRFDSKNGDFLIISKDRKVLTAKLRDSSEFELRLYRSFLEEDGLTFKFTKDGEVVQILRGEESRKLFQRERVLRLKKWLPEDPYNKPSLNSKIDFGSLGKEQSIDEYIVKTWEPSDERYHVNVDLGHLQFSLDYNDFNVSSNPHLKDRVRFPIYFDHLQLEFSISYIDDEPQYNKFKLDSMIYDSTFRAQQPLKEASPGS